MHNLRRETLFGVVFKVLAVLGTLLSMPLMLKIGDGSVLGVWFTILSVLQWVTLFDLGLASGARNTIARLRLTKNSELVTKHCTVTFCTLGVVTSIVILLFILGLFLFPYDDFLSTQGMDDNGVFFSLLISLVAVGVNFVLSLSHHIFAAYGEPKYFSLSGALINTLFLILLYICIYIGVTGIVALAVCYSLSILISNSYIIIKLFSKYPEVVPKFKYVGIDFSDLANFGFSVFVIQIAALIIFTTSKLILVSLLGSESVVIYESAFKLISVVIIIHTILMNTYWSSFTVAYEKNDWEWLSSSMKKLVMLIIPISILAVIYVYVSPYIISTWMGYKYVGDQALYVAFAIYMIMSCWSNIFAYFVNGVGLVKIQMISAIVSSFFNIPLAIYLIRDVGLGVSGAVYATCISMILFSIVGPIQVLIIFRRRSNVSSSSIS